MFGETLEVIVSDQTQAEIDRAFAYYNQINESLADRFGEEVDNALILISEMWSTYQIRYGQYRCKTIKIFPYIFHFRVSEEERKIYVQVFAHQKQYSPLD